MTDLSATPPAGRPSTDDDLLPIRDVAQLTGVNPITLRAWERRYGLIQPKRTEGGHRLYTPEDVATIRQVLGWIERGVAVGKVGELLARQQVSSATDVTAEQRQSDTDIREWRERIMLLVEQFDDRQLHLAYGELYTGYPLLVAFQDILLPVWHELRQSKGFGHSSRWLFYDQFLRSRVLQRLQRTQQSSLPRVMLAGIQARELELLSAALLLGDDHQLSVSPVAAEQPIEELALLCQAQQPMALVLWLSTPLDTMLLRQLRALALTIDCPLGLAGPGAELVTGQLSGTPIAVLGATSGEARLPLRQLLSGRLDT